MGEDQDDGGCTGEPGQGDPGPRETDGGHPITVYLPGTPGGPQGVFLSPLVASVPASGHMTVCVLLLEVGSLNTQG